MKVAIAILNWNGLRHLQAFLPSVVAHSVGYEIYVIDNASIDGSVSWINETYPHIHIIQNNRNEGFCQGYNVGLRFINADYYVLLNSDVEVTPNWIAPLISLFEEDEKIGAVQPKLLAYGNKTSFEYAGAAGGMIDWLGYPFCRGRIFDTTETDQGQYNDTTEIFWASGACLFIRASLFHSYGGFEWAFFAHMEEIDLCWRLKNNGYKVMYCAESTVYHLGGGTLQKSNPHKTFLNYRNGLFLLYKNLPVGKLFPVIFSRVVLDGVAGIRHVLKLEFRFMTAIVKAHFSFYAHLILGKVKRNNPTNAYPTPILQKTLVWQYFGKGKKKYTDLL